MIEKRPRSHSGYVAIRCAYAPSNFAPFGHFKNFENTHGVGETGPSGPRSKPYVSHVLSMGRGGQRSNVGPSEIFDPLWNSGGLWGYFARRSDAEKAPDARPSPKALQITFFDESSLRTTVL